MPLHARTPCFPSPVLSSPQREVWLKMDCCQPAGSFKIRGIGLLCQQLAEQGADALLCASGGNAGYAAAWSAKALGLRCRIVLPHSSPAHLEARLEALGATVLRHGAHWQEAHEWARAEAFASGEGYVHPFDHPLLWEGHASIVAEALEDFRSVHPDRVLPTDILVAVGGGGLLGGVLLGVEKARSEALAAGSVAPLQEPQEPKEPLRPSKEALFKPRIWAVETHGAASMHQALRSGKPVALEQLESKAHSLGALQVAQGALDLAIAYGVDSLLVSDEQAERAARRFALEHRHGIEMASGTVLAALETPPLLESSMPMCIVCGGLDALWPFP